MRIPTRHRQSKHHSDVTGSSHKLDISSKTAATLQQVGNLPKLNKIVESGTCSTLHRIFTMLLLSRSLEEEDDDAEDDDNLSTPNTTVFIGGAGASGIVDSSATASGVLRSKDLRSVVEKKRRNFSRSRSSSDSEDNGSSYDMARPSTNRKHQTRSPTRPNSFQESSDTVTGTHHPRGRSLSNIDNVIGEAAIQQQQQQQQMIAASNSESAKRRSFSRASSIVSNNRLTLNGTNEELNGEMSGTTSLTLMNDRARSLSTEHRLANPSQMSIASRTSIRYSTPRESTVFTKTDAPPVVRLLQQTPHHDTTDAIRTIIEHQRSQQTPSHHEHVQTPMIVEEDVSPPLLSSSLSTTKSLVGKKSSNGLTKSNSIVPTTESINLANGHISPLGSPTLSQNSVLSTLKYSLLKHQQQQKTNVEGSTSADDTHKPHHPHHTSEKHRVCCTII